MPIEILMPALSPTMTEGNLATWHKKEGDKVQSGDVIAEIETDKATMEVEAVDEGVIGKILVPEGSEGVAVNTPIALLLQEGEDASALDGARRGGNGAAQPEPAPVAATQASAATPSPPPAQAPGPAPSAAPAPAARGDGQANRIFASPLARRIAREANLDLAAVSGSGPQGRVVKADVEAAIASGATRKPAPAPGAEAAPAPPPAAAAKPVEAPPAPARPPVTAPAAPAVGPNAKALADAWGIPYTEVKNSNVRKTISRRLVEAKQTAPHFYLTIDCTLDPLLKFRKDLNERAGEGVKLSVNDLLIKAAAIALRRVPAANAAWTDDAILMFNRADVSVAVATPSGLITPIIQNADIKGLATISGEMKDLATRARDGKLKPEEFQGGTFTLSNLGMFGIREFAAILNPPQGCILAVGQGEQRPVVKDGGLAVATMMSCTLSVDHRVVDGAVGAEYLAAFKTLVEDPLSMLL